ncbi:ABC transporter ATP-binding protein [Oenococcus oeni]|nr:ABC transporter ATP-binding protein [Oenococcus oeni]OIL07658.1 ABC transporter ATP-binding protein [Oenococcus oeni]OIL11297.1 ABC transporter ATP-binding protein [Oenococcus oeni]
MVMTVFGEKEIKDFLEHVRNEKQISKDISYSDYLSSLENDGNAILTELRKQDISKILNLSADEFKNSNIVQSVDRLKKEIHDVSENFPKEEIINKNVLDRIEKVLNDLAIIKYLFDFSQQERNIVICGSNGSGKSTFASFLKNSYLSNLIVLPAQKFLYYNQVQNNQSKKIEDLVSFEQMDMLKLAKDRQGFDGGNKENVIYDVSNNLVNRFTLAIISLVNNHIDGLLAKERSGEMPRDYLNEVQVIWNNLFPNLELVSDGTFRVLSVQKRNTGEKYSVNTLSDGEKAVLYYLASVITAPKDSFIVVDEPETYMNPAVYNKLWDLIVDQRDDCQFIFISHNKDFIASRNKASIVWIKSFSAPDRWDLQEITDQNGIPIDLLVSLVGSSKDILFCEGKVGSLDQKLYSQLFIEDKTVIPVDGHDQVIEYTKAVNAIGSSLNIAAVGIVDGDGRDAGNVKSLEDKKIFVLPFNEIEMFFLNEEIVRNVLQQFNEVDRLLAFKDKFFKKIDEKQKQIILNITVDQTNYYLGHKRLPHIKDIDEIDDSLEEIYSSTHDDLEKERKRLGNQIAEILEKKDYAEALRICNLKGEVSRGIADKELESSFIEKALARIQIDEILRKTLRDKFFSKISNLPEDLPILN